MEKKSLGAFIALLRKEKALTQKQLAELLNVSDKTVSHWECDETSPDISLLPLLAETLGITVDELLKGERKIIYPPDSHNYIPPKSESVFDKAGNFASKTVNKIKDGMNGNINEKFRYFRILSLVGTVISCVVLFTVTLTNLLTGNFFHPTLAFTPGIIALIGSLWTIVISLGFTLGARFLFSKELFPSRATDEKEKDYICKANRITFNNLFLVFSVFPAALTGIDVLPVFANLVIVLILLVIVRLILIVILSRKGVFIKNERELLTIKYAVICCTLIALGAAFGFFFVEAWHPTADNIIFDNAEDFKAYMETPEDKPEDAYLIDGVECTMLTPDSDTETPDENGQDEYDLTIMDCYGEEISFRWLNKEVYDFSFNEDGGTFHVITYEAEIKAENLLDLRDDLLSMILPLYFVPVIIICFILYRRKLKELTDSK